MKTDSYFPLRLPLAGAMLLLLPVAVVARGETSHSRFAGVYLSDPRGPSMSLSLGADGTATVTEDAGNGSNTFFGHWVDSGSQVTITFDAVEGQPAEPQMVFQPSHDGLQAVSWNHAEWGKKTPPVMRKGHKVKDHYWLTMSPNG